MEGVLNSIGYKQPKNSCEDYVLLKLLAIRRRAKLLNSLLDLRPIIRSMRQMTVLNSIGFGF